MHFQEGDQPGRTDWSTVLGGWAVVWVELFFDVVVLHGVVILGEMLEESGENGLRVELFF